MHYYYQSRTEPSKFDINASLRLKITFRNIFPSLERDKLLIDNVLVLTHGSMTHHGAKGVDDNA